MSGETGLFVIEYEVDGYEQKFTQGPWEHVLAKEHCDDIRGYTGVRNVRLVPYETPTSEFRS